MLKALKVTSALMGIWGFAFMMLAGAYRTGTVANIFGFTGLGLLGVGLSIFMVALIVYGEEF